MQRSFIIFEVGSPEELRNLRRLSCQITHSQWSEVGEEFQLPVWPCASFDVIKLTRLTENMAALFVNRE